MSYTKEANQVIEQRGSLKCSGLSVWVRVLDFRVVWGHNHLLVTPLAGSGEEWVDARRVKFDAGADGFLGRKG